MDINAKKIKITFPDSSKEEKVILKKKGLI